MLRQTHTEKLCVKHDLTTCTTKSGACHWMQHWFIVMGTTCDGMMIPLLLLLLARRRQESMKAVRVVREQRLGKEVDALDSVVASIPLDERRERRRRREKRRRARAKSNGRNDDSDHDDGQCRHAHSPEQLNHQVRNAHVSPIAHAN